MDLLELGIAAARAGNRAEARMYLEVVTLQEPDNAQAFLWLGFVLDDPKLSMRCLERVLEIDSGNEQAQRGLIWLRSKSTLQGVPMPERLSDADLAAALKALARADPQVVVKAIRRLGESGDARAVEPLIKLLVTSKDKTIQPQARAALIAIGTPSIDPARQRLMSESDQNAALQLAAVLARVRSISALEACREVADRAKHPAARYAMVLNLAASIHGEAALNIVRDYLADTRQDEHARMTVVMTIGQAVKGKALDAKHGLQFLMGLEADAHFSRALRQAALVALGVTGDASVVRYLHQKTGDKDAALRVAAIDALARFTPPLTAMLEQLARSPDPVVRSRAAQLLAKIGSARKR